MRNPFRRQIETAVPSLRERAATLRDGLARQAAPAERADLYDRLMTLYEEDRLARPISGRESGTVAKKAADLVTNRLWDLAREIVAMPPPKTMEGLRLTALASLVLCEADHDAEDPAKVAATGLTRAALAITNTPFPAGFVGFGDEADHFERDRALFAPAGSVPTWAVAEIEAESASFPPAPTDLADACLWAVRHRAWIDGELKASEWSDERFDGESAKTNAIFTRAINEPSANLREITAKAALALEDFERFTLLPGRKLDDGTRIVHTVLHEIVGVDREAGASVALMSSSNLTAAILDSWAAWGAAQDRLRGEGTDAEVEAALAPMNRLVGAVADLPATAENIAAKALAAAWSEWVFSERHEAPRSAYPTSERCLFDIHAAITARGSQDTTLRPTPGAFDFGPDAHIAELAAEFCEAYAANIKADREHMAERMSEAEWLPHYQRATALMEKLEATEPKTLLGMALKCLGPIGAAGYNTPADESETQDDAWERVGTQFANAVLRDALTPLPTADWHASPVDLITAAGLPVEMLPVSDLCAMLDAVEILSSVAAAITCQPRQMTNKQFNGAGRLIESTTFALHRAIDAIAKELRSRTPADASDQANRLASLASLTIHNDDEAETAALARELLAMVEA